MEIDAWNSPVSQPFPMIVKSSKLWDVKIAAGRTIARRKNRRIILEVLQPDLYSSDHRDCISDLGADDNDSFADVQSEFMQELLTGKKTNVFDIECSLLPDEIVTMRILKPNTNEKKIKNIFIPKKKRRYATDDDSMESLSTLGLISVLDVSESDLWEEQCNYSIDDIVILTRMKNNVEVRFSQKDKQIQRVISFNSGSESRSFFEHVINFQRQRSEKKESCPFKQTVNILIEIGSAWDLNLNMKNLHKMHIYCVIRFNEEKLHETEGLSNTAVPIWTTLSGSFYAFSTKFENLDNSSKGLTFEVLSKDKLGSTTSFGSVSVPQHILLNSSGDRIVFQLTKRNKETGMLAVKFRNTTQEDVYSMQTLQAENFQQSFQEDASDSSMINQIHVMKSFRESKKFNAGKNVHRKKKMQHITKIVTKLHSGVKKLNLVEKFPLCS